MDKMRYVFFLISKVLKLDMKKGTQIFRGIIGMAIFTA